jgi:rhodanese-related sulfurtransferase
MIDDIRWMRHIGFGWLLDHGRVLSWQHTGRTRFYQALIQGNMAIKHITVHQAHTLQAESSTYVDVRSIPEFAQGHPAGAVNIPLLHRDERSGQMAPNPQFVAVVKASFPANAKLLIGCQMGGRSAQAAEILANAGYQDVANVLGGFGGAQNPMSRAVTQGWAQAELPVEREDTPGQSYRALLAKAGQDR